jgi:hypothetical protein
MAQAHAKRFIIEFYLEGSKKWERSGNQGLTEHFPTRELAVEALAKGDKSDAKYRIRQK